MFIFSVNLINDASVVLDSVSLSDPTWDVFLILFFITFAFLYGLFLGRDKIVNLMISTVFAYILANSLSFLSDFIKLLNIDQFSILSLIFFIIFVVVIFFFFVKKSILSNIDSYTSSWWHVLVFSIIHTGLFISLGLSLLSNNLTSVFGLISYNLFINPISLFVWIFLSIASLVLLKNDFSE